MLSSGGSSSVPGVDQSSKRVGCLTSHSRESKSSIQFLCSQRGPKKRDSRNQASQFYTLDQSAGLTSYHGYLEEGLVERPHRCVLYAESSGPGKKCVLSLVQLTGFLSRLCNCSVHA